MPLLAFLRAHHPHYPSVKALKRAIDQKQCKVNGAVERFSTHPVHPGDTVEILLGPPPERQSANVVHEEKGWIAYQKPPHQLSDPPSGLLPVHRLDKETSGVLLFAKDAKTQAELITLFKERRILKRYLALVDQTVERPTCVCENFLGKVESYQGGAIYGAVSPKAGKWAKTTFRLLKPGKEASLLLCEPWTGRTHQIRTHLASLGHPILGDFHYGRHFRSRLQVKRHMLHAYSLTIMQQEIIAPLPLDFTDAYAQLFEDPDCQDLRDWRCLTNLSRS